MDKTQKLDRLHIFRLYMRQIYRKNDIIKGMVSILGYDDIDDKLRTRVDDGRSMAMDWKKVGGDIRRSMDRYGREKALI